MPEALRTIVELMRSAKSEKVRLDATTTLLALAGVRPADGVEEEKPVGGEDKSICVIESQARAAGAPVRLAGEVARAIAEPDWREAN